MSDLKLAHISRRVDEIRDRMGALERRSTEIVNTIATVANTVAKLAEVLMEEKENEDD